MSRYYVDDLQAVEPDYLMDDPHVTVTIEDDPDFMGFARVRVEADSAARIIEFVRENWGDEDRAWFKEWVENRITKEED